MAMGLEKLFFRSLFKYITSSRFEVFKSILNFDQHAQEEIQTNRRQEAYSHYNRLVSMHLPHVFRKRIVPRLKSLCSPLSVYTASFLAALYVTSVHRDHCQSFYSNFFCNKISG